MVFTVRPSSVRLVIVRRNSLREQMLEQKKIQKRTLVSGEPERDSTAAAQATDHKNSQRCLLLLHLQVGRAAEGEKANPCSPIALPVS